MCETIVGTAMDLHMKYGPNIAPNNATKNLTPGTAGGGRELSNGRNGAVPQGLSVNVLK